MEIRKKISSFPICGACLNALFSYRIIYVDELINFSPKEIKKFRGIGKKSLSQICAMMLECGLSLKEDEPKKKYKSIYK